MISNWLNSRKNNRDAILDADRTRAEISRVTQSAKNSRMLVTRQPNIVLTVTKTAHGFTPGQAVYCTVVAGSTYWNLASALNVLGDDVGGLGAAEMYVGVVVFVPSADVFRVAMSGMMSIDDPTFLANVPQSLGSPYWSLSDTPGTLQPGLGGTSGYYPGRAVVFNHGNNLYEFISPALQSTHDHNITLVSAQTAHGFSVGDWIYLNTGTGVFAKATVATAAGFPVGMVVQVISANTFKLCYQGVVNWPGSLGIAAKFLTTGSPGTISATASVRAVAWDAGSGRVYIDGIGSTTTGTLRVEDLADYGGFPPSSGKVLYYNGSNWIALPFDLSALRDVSVPSPSAGDVLTYSGTGLWVSAPGGGTGGVALATLTDVHLSSPANGQGLIYDSGTSKWKNGNLVTALANLTDVVITSAAAGDILMWDGAEWVNIPAPANNQFWGGPDTGTGGPGYRILDSRDFPRRMIVSGVMTGSGGKQIAFDHDASMFWFTTVPSSYSDSIADPPTSEHFGFTWDNSSGFGSDTGGAYVMRHTRDASYRKLAINRDMQVKVSLGNGSHTYEVVLRLDQVLDLVGATVGSGLPTNISIVPRQIGICVGGVAKNVVVLASADY